MKNKQLPFWIFTITLFIALLLPTLLMDGMFFDGLINSSIARNLSKGDGSFWSLHYSKFFTFPFSDQLPLSYGLQALFFKIFGDHLYVERLYSFLTAVISGIFITKIWRQVFRNYPEYINYSWLPFFLWIVTPVVFWSFSNNMLENTVTVFDVAAVYLILKSEVNKSLFQLFIAGLLILAATLSKSPIGLFPLVTIALYGIIFQNISFSKIFQHTLLILFSIIFFLFVLYVLDNNSFASIIKYLNQQVIGSIAGRRETVSSRFFIVGRLMGELVPIVIFSLIVFIFSFIRKMEISVEKNINRLFFFFLLLGLSSSLPIMISIKQSGYYLVPSFPFFALAGGVFMIPRVSILFQNIDVKVKGFKPANIIAIFLLISVLIYSFAQAGKIKRDQEVVKGIYAIGKIVPKDSSVSYCKDLYDDWKLHAYLMRYFYISLDNDDKHEYYISKKYCKNEFFGKNYIKMDTGNNIYEVYRRK